MTGDRSIFSIEAFLLECCDRVCTQPRMLVHSIFLRLAFGKIMKILVLLFLALVGTSFGIMLTEGTTRFIFQISFFCVIGFSLLSQAIDL